MKKETSNLPQNEALNIGFVMPRFRVNGLIEGKECWILTDSFKVAEKVQMDAECNGLCSIIYELTDDGWI
ncbi:MAG: hypothetical protein ACOCVF_00750 [bacterium]